MKRLYYINLFLIIALGLPLSGQSQGEIEYAYQKVSVGIHVAPLDFRPHVTFNLNRSQIGAGLVLRKPQHYYWEVSPGSYSYYLGPSQKGFGINGANLFYRFFPLKPKESLNICFEYYTALRNDLLDYNGEFYQRNYRFTQAIHVQVQYHFLERFSFFFSGGPALTLYFAEDTEGINILFPKFENYPRLNPHLNLTLGLEIGLGQR